MGDPATTGRDEAAALAAAEGPSQSDRVLAFHTEATRCLRRVGIGRKGSRLSELYAGLEEIARSASPTGAAPWEAAIDGASSQAMGGLLEGGPEVCLRLLEDQLARAHDAADAASLQLAGARVLRLGARFEEARARLERVHGDAHADAKAWELAAIESMRAGDPSPLRRALRTGAVARTGTRMLELSLWTRASRAKAHLRELPTATALRRAAGGEGDPAAWHAALVLERAYETTLPLSSRVASALRALQETRQSPIPRSSCSGSRHSRDFSRASSRPQRARAWRRAIERLVCPRRTARAPTCSRSRSAALPDRRPRPRRRARSTAPCGALASSSSRRRLAPSAPARTRRKITPRSSPTTSPSGRARS